MFKKSVIATSLTLAIGLIVIVFAQPPGPRMHRVIKKGELKLIPATSTPMVPNEVRIEIVGDQRVITSNGVPDHKTGQFPNRGNPNRLSAQQHVYRVPAKPQAAATTTPMRGRFGVAVNGVPFDPGAGEFYEGAGHRQGAGHWQYEPLSGAIELGIDVSHAHVQPDGNYHYHGLPTGLLDAVKLDPNKHSPQIGWAADGFPIYAVYGYSDPKDASSPVKKLTSSYQLKQGDRPGGDQPGGKYDGTFVADYEYVEGSGDLDECNGRFTVTPDAEDGTYAYYLTEAWPVVPRVYRGTPSPDFQHVGMGGPGGGPGGRGGRGGRPGDPGGRGGRPSEPGGRPGGQRPGGFGPSGGPPFGGPPFGGPPRPGQVLPSFLQDALKLTDEQRKQLATLQTEVDRQLADILTAEQLQQLADPQQFGPPGPGMGGGPPGRRRESRPPVDEPRPQR